MALADLNLITFLVRVHVGTPYGLPLEDKQIPLPCRSQQIWLLLQQPTALGGCAANFLHLLGACQTVSETPTF